MTRQARQLFLGEGQNEREKKKLRRIVRFDMNVDQNIPLALMGNGLVHGYIGGGGLKNHPLPNFQLKSYIL